MSEDRLQLRLAAHLLLHLGRNLGLAADQGLHHLCTLPGHVLHMGYRDSFQLQRSRSEAVPRMVSRLAQQQQQTLMGHVHA